MQEPLFHVHKNGKDGFINSAGQVVIDVQFDGASSFAEGIARVFYKGKTGCIDTTGKLVIPIRYDEIRVFSEGLAAVQVNEKWGYMSKTGEMVITPAFYTADCFENGYAKVREDMFTAGSLIDREGKTVLTKGLGLTSAYREGLIACKEDDHWGFMNIAGEIVIKPMFLYAYSFYEGKAAVAPVAENRKRKRDNHLYGFIDKQGEMVIPPKFQGTAVRFSEGLCAVSKNDFGYIDVAGELVIPYQFYLGEHFSEDMACVRIEEDGKYGFINKAGTVVIEPRFDDADGFENGLAAVYLGKDFNKRLYGYINKNGDYVWAPAR